MVRDVPHHHPGETQSLLAEVEAAEFACRRDVALVVDRVDHGQHHVDPVADPLRLRKPDPGVAAGIAGFDIVQAIF